MATGLLQAFLKYAINDLKSSTSPQLLMFLLFLGKRMVIYIPKFEKEICLLRKGRLLFPGKQAFPIQTLRNI